VPFAEPKRFRIVSTAPQIGAGHAEDDQTDQPRQIYAGTGRSF